MKTLLTRAASGAVFVALVVGSFIAGFWYAASLFLIFSVLASTEYIKLGQLKAQGVWFVLSALITYIVSVGVAIGEFDTQLFWLLVPLTIISAAIEVISTKRDSFRTTAGFAWGLMYIPMGFAWLMWLSMTNGQYAFEIPLGVIFLVWINDTGAYLVGSSIGKRKLIPRVSPGKSWEGFIGGIVIAIAASFLIGHFWYDLTQTQWVVAAVCAGLIGTLGDLFESRMKRKVGVKDSGNIMPGHGGALDRFDALLFVVPAVMAYLQLST